MVHQDTEEVLKDGLMHQVSSEALQLVLCTILLRHFQIEVSNADPQWGLPAFIRRFVRFAWVGPAQRQVGMIFLQRPTLDQLRQYSCGYQVQSLMQVIAQLHARTGNHSALATLS